MFVYVFTRSLRLVLHFFPSSCHLFNLFRIRVSSNVRPRSLYNQTSCPRVSFEPCPVSGLGSDGWKPFYANKLDEQPSPLRTFTKDAFCCEVRHQSQRSTLWNQVLDSLLLSVSIISWISSLLLPFCVFLPSPPPRRVLLRRHASRSPRPPRPLLLGRFHSSSGGERWEEVNGQKRWFLFFISSCCLTRLKFH